MLQTVSLSLKTQSKHEITTDAEDKIICYRKEDSLSFHNKSIESPKIAINSLTFSDSA